MGSSDNDPDIERIKARKLHEMRKMAANVPKPSEKSTTEKKKSAKDVVQAILYDRGDEVLEQAYSQFPVQTQSIVMRIAELIQSGELRTKISGGELLSLFRSVGLRVKIDTTIKVEDHGKLISFSDRLKQLDE
jgi:DNA-binding TFAR19-related protein (PDSD5 family)